MTEGTYHIRKHHDVHHSGELPDADVKQIAICIESSFGGTITREDAHHHMSGDQVLVASPVTGSGLIAPEVAGFTSVSMRAPSEEFGDDSLSSQVGAYFAAAAIAREHQSKGLYQQFVDDRFAYAMANDAEFIYTRTQNPRVLRGVTTRLEHAIVDGEIKRYALEIKLAHCAYEHMLTATKPHVRGTIFEKLDYDASDAFLLTWFLE